MNPNDLGKRFLVDECQKVSISNFMKEGKRRVKMALIESSIELLGIDIKLRTSETGFGGIRYWFECPNCKRRVGVVYVNPITHALGCRICLDLEYRKRRYRGMVEAENIM